MPSAHPDLTRRTIETLRERLELERDTHRTTLADGPPSEPEPHSVETFAVVRRTLDEIDLALARLDQGQYGTCELCERAIPLARLEALPHTRSCVQCAGRGAASHTGRR